MARIIEKRIAGKVHKLIVAQHIRGFLIDARCVVGILEISRQRIFGIRRIVKIYVYKRVCVGVFDAIDIALLPTKSGICIKVEFLRFKLITQ